MKKIDVAVIGAGAAGIACGIRLLSKGKDNFMIFEKGHFHEKRYCFVDHGGTCMSCKDACNVISGFGGCIHYGDSVKLSVYPSGKRLYHLLGEDEYYSCLKFAVEHFFQDQYLEFKVTDGKRMTAMDVKDYGVCPLSSERIKEVLHNAFSYLLSSQCISLETMVEGIEKKDDGFLVALQRISGREVVFAKKVVIATGREGIKWWKGVMEYLGVKSKLPVASLGFRFEMDKRYLSHIGAVHPDLKLRFYKGGRKFKTFCFCAGKNGGKLKCEKFGGFTLLDGHILMDNDKESDYANFALLMQLVQEGEQATSPQVLLEYIERYKKLSGDSGMPIYQKYVSFKKKEEYPEKNGTSLVGARSAPVWKILNSREHELFCEVADEIFHWIIEMNKLGPDEAEDFEQAIYTLGLEVESLWDTVLIDKAMMTSVDGLYVIGDCAGIAQGIMPAVISGIYVANKL